MLMTRAGSPWVPAFSSCRRRKRVRWKMPFTLRFMTLSKASSGYSSSRAPHGAPALLTRMWSAVSRAAIAPLASGSAPTRGSLVSRATPGEPRGAPFLAPGSPPSPGTPLRCRSLRTLGAPNPSIPLPQTSSRPQTGDGPRGRPGTTKQFARPACKLRSSELQLGGVTRDLALRIAGSARLRGGRRRKASTSPEPERFCGSSPAGAKSGSHALDCQPTPMRAEPH